MSLRSRVVAYSTRSGRKESGILLLALSRTARAIWGNRGGHGHPIDLGGQGAQGAALALHPVVVARPGAVAHEGQRLVPVQVVRAGLGDGHPYRVLPLPGRREADVHGLGDVDVQPAQGVHQVHEARHVDQHVVIDLQAEQEAQHLAQGLHARVDGFGEGAHPGLGVGPHRVHAVGEAVAGLLLEAFPGGRLLAGLLGGGHGLLVLVLDESVVPRLGQRGIHHVPADAEEHRLARVQVDAGHDHDIGAHAPTPRPGVPAGEQDGQAAVEAVLLEGGLVPGGLIRGDHRAHRMQVVLGEPVLLGPLRGVGRQGRGGDRGGGGGRGAQILRTDPLVDEFLLPLLQGRQVVGHGQGLDRVDGLQPVVEQDGVGHDDGGEQHHEQGPRRPAPARLRAGTEAPLQGVGVGHGEHPNQQDHQVHREDHPHPARLDQGAQQVDLCPGRRTTRWLPDRPLPGPAPAGRAGDARRTTARPRGPEWRGQPPGRGGRGGPSPGSVHLRLITGPASGTSQSP